jgi:hypothetical protein
MANVLVLFQADEETTEQLALAVGVGAVEAGGNIRLRRLSRPGAPEVGHKGYGVLKAADLEWAETMVVGLESAAVAEEELTPLLVLLEESRSMLIGKKVWTFSPATFAADGLTTAQGTILEAAKGAGLVPLEIETASGASVEEKNEAAKAAGRICAG